MSVRSLHIPTSGERRSASAVSFCETSDSGWPSVALLRTWFIATFYAYRAACALDDEKRVYGDYSSSSLGIRGNQSDPRHLW